MAFLPTLFLDGSSLTGTISDSCGAWTSRQAAFFFFAGNYPTRRVLMARMNSGIGCRVTSAEEAANYRAPDTSSSRSSSSSGGAPPSVSSTSRTDEPPAPPSMAPSSPSSRNGNACAGFMKAVCPSADSVADSQPAPYMEFVCCSDYSSTATLCGDIMRLMRSDKVC
ncbi:hypothetical_protein [Leishmania major strain Friedlin]|nr:hypothetical_protein [Leishmania major strain Friedlin]